MFPCHVSVGRRSADRSNCGFKLVYSTAATPICPTELVTGLAVAVKVEHVDPRDGRYREMATAYRVYFWELAYKPERGIPPLWSSDEYELTDVRDVAEVLEWAEASSKGRAYTLYAIHDRGTDRGLIQLLGVDPTREPVSPPTA